MGLTHLNSKIFRFWPTLDDQNYLWPTLEKVLRAPIDGAPDGRTLTGCVSKSKKMDLLQKIVEQVQAIHVKP